jgi:hypothetical protein
MRGYIHKSKQDLKKDTPVMTLTQTLASLPKPVNIRHVERERQNAEPPTWEEQIAANAKRKKKQTEKEQKMAQAKLDLNGKTLAQLTEELTKYEIELPTQTKKVSTLKDIYDSHNRSDNGTDFWQLTGPRILEEYTFQRNVESYQRKMIENLKNLIDEKQKQKLLTAAATDTNPDTPPEPPKMIPCYPEREPVEVQSSVEDEPEKPYWGHSPQAIMTLFKKSQIDAWTEQCNKKALRVFLESHQKFIKEGTHIYKRICDVMAFYEGMIEYHQKTGEIVENWIVKSLCGQFNCIGQEPSEDQDSRKHTVLSPRQIRHQNLFGNDHFDPAPPKRAFFDEDSKRHQNPFGRVTPKHPDFGDRPIHQRVLFVCNVQHCPCSATTTVTTTATTATTATTVATPTTPDTPTTAAASCSLAD